MQILKLLQAQQVAQQQGRSYAVLTLASTQGTTSRTNGKMLVFEDGSSFGTIGGGPGEFAAIADARQYIGTQQTLLHTYSQCHGSLTVLIETFKAAPLLVLCGGGNVSRCLMQHAKLAGFRLWLFDPRPKAQIEEAVALADRFFPVETYEAALQQTQIPDDAFYVSASFSHETDASAVAGILQKHFTYAGMLGSRAKIETLFTKLQNRGFTPAQLASLHTPIGLDLGGQTPEELAVGILAEILIEKNRAGKFETQSTQQASEGV